MEEIGASEFENQDWGFCNIIIQRIVNVKVSNFSKITCRPGQNA